MKLLDRYILWMFLKNYLISFTVLIGLYVVFDLIFNFDELAELQTQGGASAVSSTLALLGDVAAYYFYRGFLFFVHLSGIIPVVAAAFTLMRLSRFNELSAVLAAGVPLLRLAMPVIIAALVLNVLLLLDQELVIPRLLPQLIRRHDEIHRSGARSFRVRAMLDENNNLLLAGAYHPPADGKPARMEMVDILQRDAELRPTAHIAAERAQWDSATSQWVLSEGRITTGLLPEQNPSPPQPIATYKSNITPEEIALYRSRDYVDLLSTERINQLLQRPKNYGSADLLRVKHFRFAQPLMNVVLLLLAVGSILTREPGRLKVGAGQCLMLTALALGSIFLAHQMAGHPPAGAQWADRWPALMAWAPIFLFGPLAVWLLDRVKT